VFEPREAIGALATLMDVRIETGRTHQIRVHAAFAGHPVAGDERYGEREFNARLRAYGLRRMFLHAAAVSFRWPGGEGAFTLRIGLPPDLAAPLAALPRGRGAQD